MEAENPTLEVDHGSNLDGHGPGEMVHVEVQVRERGQLPNLPWYGALDAIVVQVQPLEAPEPGDRRRQAAGEPAALQRDGRDASGGVAGDAEEGAAARVAGGVPGAQDPAGRVKCPPERRERTGVLRVARRGGGDGEEHEQVQEGEGDAEERRRHWERERSA